MLRMTILTLLILLPALLLGGCGTTGPTVAPWFIAETLSKKEVEGFEKIMQSLKARGCTKTKGNLAIRGQSGEWEKIDCYGMEPGTETPYVEILK